MSETLGDLAPYFFQTGYVVREVDVAEEWFQRVMGVPSFFRMENVAFGEGCSYRGRPADAVAHLSIGYLGETQIELIESVRGPSIYTEFLERKGPGLHHLAFAVPDFGASVAALREAGRGASRLSKAKRRAAAKRVRDAIESLPEAHRVVLILRDIEGVDTAETAKLLSVKPNLVKVRLHRARQALRNLLEPHLRESLS